MCLSRPNGRIHFAGPPTHTQALHLELPRAPTQAALPAPAAELLSLPCPAFTCTVKLGTLVVQGRTVLETDSVTMALAHSRETVKTCHSNADDVVLTGICSCQRCKQLVVDAWPRTQPFYMYICIQNRKLQCEPMACGRVVRAIA